MSTPKSSKNANKTSIWIICDKCSTNVLQKDADVHKKDCPPNVSTISYPLIKNSVIYGFVDVKGNEEIKALSQKEKDNLVFLSQSAIQLCNLSIGDCAVVTPISENLVPIVRNVWPTTEKSSSSILFTKNDVELTFEKANIQISVQRIPNNVLLARKLNVVALNASKRIELNSEISNRLHKSYLNKLLTVGNKINILYYGKVLIFQIKHIEPFESESLDENLERLSIENKTTFYKVVDKTSWTVFKDEALCDKEIKSNDLYARIGGLEEEIEEIRELMLVALGKRPVIPGFKLGRSVLLYGSSGTGKNLITHALAKESRSNIVFISPAELYSKYSTSPEETIKNLFRDAEERSPSVIILDEIDILCPLRSSRLNDTEKRVSSSILTSLDDIGNLPDSKIFIIAITNKIESVDSSFRRCGRLDREIEIPVPNPKARFDILTKLLTDVPSKLNSEDIRDVSGKTHGFVGADLVSLCSHAVLHASRRCSTELDLEDFYFALARVRPSAMREVQIEVPNVKWSDIGGQESLKLILRQAVEWPLKHAESFVRLGITPPKGVLMYGPPGCSKTMIAKALATESGLNFLSIKGPELFSKWVGESERAVREVFRKARQVAPSIIFFDEIDALGGERSSGSSTSVQERVLAQLLTELDGVTPLGDVTVLAATNRPDRIDKALLRPGRLDRIVYVPLPDEETRREIFKIKLCKMPVVGIQLEDLVEHTKGYSGAEINAVCHEAAMKALECSLEADCVTQEHFLEALKIITPRTSSDLLKIYNDLKCNSNKEFFK